MINFETKELPDWLFINWHGVVAGQSLTIPKKDLCDNGIDIVTNEAAENGVKIIAMVNGDEVCFVVVSVVGRERFKECKGKIIKALSGQEKRCTIRDLRVKVRMANFDSVINILSKAGIVSLQKEETGGKGRPSIIVRLKNGVDAM